MQWNITQLEKLMERNNNKKKHSENFHQLSDILSQISWTYKDKYYMVSITRGDEIIFKMKRKQSNIFKKPVFIRPYCYKYSFFSLFSCI